MSDDQGGETQDAAHERADPVRLSFGEVEARLARLHEISSDKRTQFQARLRNFQKHGIPHGVGAGRGRAVKYSPGQVVEMALAVELAQLGLLPERIAEIWRLNKFPIFMATRMAAQALLDKGGFLPDRDRVDENMTIATGSQWVTHDEADDPMSMFLFFDPTALASLTDIPEKYEDQASATFFYGGPGIVRENIVRWTAGPHTRRLSLINVTAMLWSLVVRTKPERQKSFMQEVVDWANALEDMHFVETVADAAEETPVIVIETVEDIVEHAETLKNLKGLPRVVGEAMVRRAQQMIDTGKMPGPDAGLSGKPWKDMSELEVEEELVGQLALGGLPEMIARGAMESTKRWRTERKAEREAKEKEGHFVERSQIEAAGLDPHEVGRSGKTLADMSPAEFAEELERRGGSALAQPDNKPKPRKAKKHGDRN